MNRLALVVGLLFLNDVASAEVPRDAELAKLVVGKWKYSIEFPAIEFKWAGITEYKTDGTVISSGYFVSSGKRSTLHFEGTWSVKGRVLTWTVKKTSNPELMAVGETHTEQILEINEKQLKYRGDEGEIEVETRVVDEPDDKDGEEN